MNDMESYSCMPKKFRLILSLEIKIPDASLLSLLAVNHALYVKSIGLGIRKSNSNETMTT